MNLQYPSIIDFGLKGAAEVLARAFEDYFVRIPFDVRTLLHLARADSVDLASSCLLVRDGTAVGAALIARRGWTCRLAAMAIVPEARRAGLGRGAVLHLLTEAKARGDRLMMLEVIEQNIAGVELYRACGFQTIRRLIGFTGPPAPDAIAPSDLIEVDLREVAQAVTLYGLPDLPWQLSGETLAQLAPPNIACRLDGVWIAISNPAEPVMTVRGLIAEPTAQHQGREAALLRAVMAKHPGKEEWRFNPIWPEEVAPVITPSGLTRGPLSQWQMRRQV